MMWYNLTHDNIHKQFSIHLEIRAEEHPLNHIQKICCIWKQDGLSCNTIGNQEHKQNADEKQQIHHLGKEKKKHSKLVIFIDQVFTSTLTPTQQT